jgi:hypothetical protein
MATSRLHEITPKKQTQVKFDPAVHIPFWLCVNRISTGPVARYKTVGAEKDLIVACPVVKEVVLNYQQCSFAGALSKGPGPTWNVYVSNTIEF